MTTSTTSTAIKKIDLAAKVQEHNARVRAEKRQAAIAYVETALVPHLERLAEAGTRFVIITPPGNLDLKDILEALDKKVECIASVNGLRGRINISW